MGQQNPILFPVSDILLQGKNRTENQMVIGGF